MPILEDIFLKKLLFPGKSIKKEISQKVGEIWEAIDEKFLKIEDKV